VTDLRRLTLNPVMRLILVAMFAVAKQTGLENRILAMASLNDADPSIDRMEA
jgi:hypothetical protein